MIYELAKKLKDGGFPQGYAAQAGTVHYPTLSELLEACGEDFASLSTRKAHGQLLDWRAENWSLGDKRKLIEYGATPEEAIAMLWLALKGVRRPN